MLRPPGTCEVRGTSGDRVVTMGEDDGVRTFSREDRARYRDKVGGLAPAVGHFLKVSRSYWWGLFHCYEVEDLPRTNNALEQLFGSYRHHERRVSGCKVASPALVLRGSARILAAVATRQRPERLPDVKGADRARWAELRATLAERRQRRVERRRFRRDPEGYLRQLEAKLIRLILPP